MKRKWNLKHANWDEYTQKLNENIQNLHTTINDVNNTIDELTKIIIHTAETTIKYKKTTSNPKKNAPWWNSSCQEVTKEVRRTLYKYQKLKTPENLTDLKKSRAKARSSIREAKRKSWREYVNQLNKDTPIKTI